jgi:hypothetical protein
VTLLTAQVPDILLLFSFKALVFRLEAQEVNPIANTNNNNAEVVLNLFLIII